jgi:hypothetical protein
MSGPADVTWEQIDQEVGGRKDRPWEHVYAAAKTGQICGDCRRDLAVDEPVWRLRCYIDGMFGVLRQVAPVCHDCYHDWPEEGLRYPGKYWMLAGYHGDGWWYPEVGPKTRPCEGCGRLVTAGTEERARFCCDQCRLTVRNRRRRESRTQARAGLRCEGCGGPVEAGRSDARWCSNACRQQAYRDRSS